MKKISLFFSIFLFSGIANAEIITSKSLYNFAKSRDYTALQKFSRRINVVNNGDTAVCLAIKNNDVEAYKLLLRYGANSRPECYSYAIKYRNAVLNGKPIPAISSKGSGFLGMSTTGWAITGGALAVGGVASAAGGGGGGGSGGDEESSNEGVVEDFVKNCINGKQEGGECICYDGWTGALCNRPAVCPYNTISCKEGYEKTGKVCKSGETLYQECKPVKVPDGYTMIPCGDGYKTLDKMKSGSNIYYLCELETCSDKGYKTDCGEGYDETPSCVEGTTQYYQCTPTNCSEKGYVTSCATGMEKEQKCLSGTTPYYQCILPEGYSEQECTGGYVQDGNSINYNGKTYYKCKERDCSGYTTSCGEGYDANPSCLSGTTQYYTCTEKEVPDGYTSTPCGKGTATFDTILSGEMRYYKCVSCGSIDEFGNCLLTFDDGIEYAVNGETINTTDIIGIEAEKPVKNAYFDGINKRDGTIKIENNQDGDIYGIKSTEIVYNNYEGGVGSININNHNNVIEDNIYGIYSGKDVYNNNGGEEAIIEINNRADYSFSGEIYGIYSDKNVYNNGGGKAIIKINNESYESEEYVGSGDNGVIYGIYADGDIYYNQSNGESILNITNKGDQSIGIAGIYSYGGGIYAENGYNVINIDNDGLGDIYAIWADQINLDGDYNTLSTSIIRISNNNNSSTGYVYGINGSLINADYKNETSISIVNQGQGDTYGVYGTNINVDEANIEIANVGDGTAYGGYTITDYSVDFSSINIHNLGLGTAIGIYGQDTSITGQANLNMINVKSIIIDRENYTDNKLTEDTADDVTYEASNEYGGTAIGIYIKKYLWTSQNIEEITITGAETGIGIYVESEGRVSNKGTINVSAENAFGIYMKSGISVSGITEIYNEGTINVSGTNAYGIYVEDGTGVTVSNYGTIIVNGSECTGTCNGTSANGNYIVLNGASLFNEGVMKARAMNLNNMGGTVLATENSSFEIEDEFSGDLTMSSDIVTTGFDDVYTTTNTINAGDTSNLNLLSQSALFDASLAENNLDVNLKMKQFNEVVDNKSLADFLQNNYAMKNNETFFNTLKKQETVASLNDTLSDLTGQKLFSRFADEDLMMMRELTFDMNNRLFMNDEDHLETSGNISTFNFNGNSGSNSRYALINQDYGSYKLGLNYGFADVRSYDNNDDNRREEMMFHMGMPISYHKKGFKFITTPHVGYASGTYDRKGLNSENYDGHIEKTMFGLMNEARYPIAFDKWTIAPSVEFNVVNYTTKGHEKGGTNPLNLDLQHNYSVEAGLGLYANTEHKFGKNAKLSFTGGVAMYHEFADPYKLSIGMEGMNGKFDIRDENRSDNRAVIRTGLKFANDNMSLGANVMSYIDREYRTNATLDFKYNF